MPQHPWWAYGVPDSDHRPTGPTVDGLGWHHQRTLDRWVRQYVEDHVDWSAHLPAAVTSDKQAADLTRRLHELQRRRPDVAVLIQRALDEPRPLPVENPADALWWRIVAVDASTPRPGPKPVPPPEPRQISHDVEDQALAQRRDRYRGISR